MRLTNYWYCHSFVRVTHACVQCVFAWLKSIHFPFHVMELDYHNINYHYFKLLINILYYNKFICVFRSTDHNNPAWWYTIFHKSNESLFTRTQLLFGLSVLQVDWVAISIFWVKRKSWFNNAVSCKCRYLIQFHIFIIY